MNWLRAGTAMLRVVQSGIVSLVDRTQTVTGLWTYDRGTSAPFAVENTSAAVVTNLDADKLDGQHASAFATSGHTHEVDEREDMFDDTSGDPADVSNSAASDGVSSYASRLDHVHLLTAAVVRALGFFDTSNDGAGSGLDADLLDGSHASAFAGATHASNHTDGTDDIQDATSGQKGLMTAAYASKLDGIESGATQDQTAAEILTALLTVDGSGSGLDADTVDGSHASAFATSGHIHANAVDVSGTPTAGRTVEWTDANTIEDAGFATSDIARLSQAQTFAESQTVETSGVDGWILQKTGLAHGITNKAPTDVHGAFESYSVNGGAYLLGITKSASEAGFFFDGATTQSTVSTPVILMYAGKKSGASTTALTGTEPIWHLINGGSTVALSLLGNGNFGIGAVPTAPLDVNGNRMRIRTSKTPSSASDTGNAGEICWDSSYIYVCTATDTWKRVAIATW